MSKEYYQKLSHLLSEIDVANEAQQALEIKHFFSGAALYANKTICASWSPAGLAFKLPAAEVRDLLASGEAIPLQYFPNGHIKKGYALFENPCDRTPTQWKEYFVKAIRDAS